MRGRNWSEDDVTRLHRMVEQGYNPTEIGRSIGRSATSVYTKANKLGLKPARRVKRFLPPDGLSSEAARLCMFANVPFPLAQYVTESATHAGIDLKSFRSDARVKEYVELRQTISVEARKHGYSFEQIGRALNRDHSSICYLVNLSTVPPTGTENSAPRAECDRIAA